MTPCRYGHDPSHRRYWSQGPNRPPGWRCSECHREQQRALRERKGITLRPRGPQYAWLWEDDNAEYRHLREVGLSPRQIGDKVGVKWLSFQRALHRKIGGKNQW